MWKSLVPYVQLDTEKVEMLKMKMTKFKAKVVHDPRDAVAFQALL